MTKRKGSDWSVAISSSDSGYTVIGNLKSVDLGIAHNEIDFSDNDSAGWDETEYGQGALSPSITGNYNDADAGQLELRAAAEGKTKVWLRFRPAVEAGEREFRSRYVITAWDLGGALDAIQEFTASFKSDGAPTFADQ